MILAGGVGRRMNFSIPKQFVVVNGLTVLQHTMLAFQRHQLISAIYVVCSSQCQENVTRQALDANIDKFVSCLEAGDNAFLSARNGILQLGQIEKEECVVLIHDAVRPLISEKIIDDNIEGVKKYGNAITVLPSNSALLYSVDKLSSNRVVDRDLIANTQTPQSLRLKKFREIHLEALDKGIEDTVATCTLLVELGNTVYFVDGDEMNFKITTAEHIDLLKAYLNMRDE